MNGWRDSTKKQYAIYINKWLNWCEKEKWEPTEPNITCCIKFLMSLYKLGYGYSALNSARSALSCIFDDPPIGEHKIICRFMRGVFNERPTKARYNEIWDVSVVLKMFRKWAPARGLSLQLLSFKLVTLLAIVSGQRCQTIHNFNIRDCVLKRTKVVFTIRENLKHNSPKNNDSNIIIPAYFEDKRLCAVTYFKEYVKRTKPVRNTDKLFISYVKPNKEVSRDTISRWIKITLSKAGINTNIFKAHSTRAAAASAIQSDVDINTILKTAGWSRATTFAKFYNKTIIEPEKFGKTVLSK